MSHVSLSRILAVSVFGALSLAAILATSAQAAEFQIQGKPALLATLTGSQEGTGSLLIPGRNLTINCQSTAVNVGSEIVSPSKALVKLTFSMCSALNHAKGTELPCTIDNPTVTALFLPLAGNTLLKEPDSSETFTTVLLLGEICPLPEENPVQGTLTAEVKTNNSVVDLITFNKSSGINFGGFPSTFTGSATLELTGAHKGLKFGVA
jgi:hypothetical protein